MAKNRDRAWRRSQRARAIRNRKDRIPEDYSPDPVYLWQLHSKDGKPLDLLHRSRQPPEEGVTEVEVTLIHSYGCVKGPQRWALQLDVLRGHCPPPGPCVCKTVKPSWGYPLRPEPGSVWKFLREYTPDSRPFPAGRLDKTPSSATSPYKGWRETSKDTGNMKFQMNNHRGKEFVGWFDLGKDITFRSRHWREWEDSWGGADWGEPETDDE